MTSPKTINTIAEAMMRFYMKWYGPAWASYLERNEREHTDVRHLVRWRMHRHFGAGYTAIAKAEELISRHRPDHTTIRNSFFVAEQTLPESNPMLIQDVDLFLDEVLGSASELKRLLCC